MIKKLAVFLVAGTFVVSLSACGKSDKAGQQPAGGQKKQGDLVLPQKGQEAVVNVPAEVKGKWAGIKLKVEDKKAKSTKDITVKLGQSSEIPGTNMSITASEFLPSFVMQGLNITSSTNESTNPAAKVVITEGGKEIFKGWLFQKYPTTHAFTHPNYSITLVEGVKS